jgi:hypothetical protein
MMRRLVVGVLFLALVTGCTAARVQTAGVAGPVAWQATEFTRAETTVNGQPGARYAFTLRVQEPRGTGLTFTTLHQAISQHGVQPVSTQQTGRWRLQPHGELHIPISFSWYCPQAFEGCARVVGAPRWVITLSGSDDRGQPVTAIIEVSPPATSS